MPGHCRHPGNSNTSIHEKRTDIRVLDLLASTRREPWSHTHQENKKHLIHPPEERMRRGQDHLSPLHCSPSPCGSFYFPGFCSYSRLYITSEDLELGEREHVTFAFLGLGYHTQYDLF
ncbi:hypothetical protein H671_8g19752 [Cricetulus griseus]|nr:hypothetical protein H671_8g19752 [Cricetulus griseus]